MQKIDGGDGDDDDDDGCFLQTTHQKKKETNLVQKMMVMVMMLLQKMVCDGRVWWSPTQCSAGGGGGGCSGDTTHHDIIIVACCCCCCCSQCEAHLTFALGPPRSPSAFFFGCFFTWELCTVKSAAVLCYSSLHFHYDALLLLTPCCCWFNLARTHQPQIQIFWFLVVEFMNCF